MKRTIYAAVLLQVLTPVSAGEFMETNADFDGLPDVIEFDCFPSADSTREFIQPFDRRMRIPENFQKSASDSNEFKWNVRIVAEEGESMVYPYAALQYGKIESEASIDLILRDFDLVSTATGNGFGVDVYLSRASSPGFRASRWLFLLAEDEYLRVVSEVEIDWSSLLTCFE